MPPRRGTRLRASNTTGTIQPPRSVTKRSTSHKYEDEDYEETEFLDEIEASNDDNSNYEQEALVSSNVGKTKRAKTKKRQPSRTTTKPPSLASSRAVEETADESFNNIPIPEGFEYLEISINDPHVFEQEIISNKNIILKGKRAAPTYDKGLRSTARHAHLICLLIAYSKKSLNLLTPILRAHSLSLLPSHLMRQFCKENIEDGRTLLNGLSMLANWWKNQFKRQKLSIFDSNVDLGFIRWLPERINHIWLRSIADKRTGCDEDLVALFTVILRALGLKARFVVSLQPNLVKPINSLTMEKSNENSSSRDQNSSPLKSSSPPSPPSPSSSLMDKNIPQFWSEVWHPTEQRWVPVDCLRAIVNDRLSMEPAGLLLTKIGRQHLFIIAFDEKGRPFDVTRRYCSRYYGWTARLRKSDEPYLKAFICNLEMKEEEELANLVDGEPLPTTLAGFTGHSRYMLEKQLHKYSVFYPPDAGIVGEFRGQNVRLRSVVKSVKSKEAWYTQFGRVIKEGEEPIKKVKLLKKPERKSKKNMKEWEREIGEAANPATVKEYTDQSLWGEWQTIPFQPAVAENGKVPRNKFGNVDLYLPSMLPIGCVWINDDVAWRAAKDLGVDYASACIRFAFSGRFAVPNLRGIVICQEFEGSVLKRLIDLKEELANAELNNAEEGERKKAKMEKRKKKIREKILQEHDATFEAIEAEESGAIVSALADNQPSKEQDVELEDLF